MQENKEQLKLVYVFDPLCGWCFGMEHQIKDLVEQFEGKVGFETWCGGMVPVQNAAPIKNIRSLIEDALPVLESRSGVSFSSSFMKDILYCDKLVLSSELPSFVFNTIKRKKVDNEIQLAYELHEIMYKEGKDFNLLSSYKSLLDKYEINELEVFDPKIKKQTLKEFEKCKKLGIRSFPSLLIQNGKNYQVLSQGFLRRETLNDYLWEEINK